MKEIETIPPAEAAEILRGFGMSATPGMIRQGLKQGVFPFGDYIETEKGTPIFHIYRVLFDKWCAERVTEVEA